MKVAADPDSQRKVDFYFKTSTAEYRFRKELEQTIAQSELTKSQWIRALRDLIEHWYSKMLEIGNAYRSLGVDPIPWAEWQVRGVLFQFLESAAAIETMARFLDPNQPEENLQAEVEVWLRNIEDCLESAVGDAIISAPPLNPRVTGSDSYESTQYRDRQQHSTRKLASRQVENLLQGVSKRRQRLPQNEEFDELVGKMMIELWKLPKHERNVEIAVTLDAKSFALLDHLEETHRNHLKANNKAFPQDKITTFSQALGRRRWQGAVNKRFLRARGNYKERHTTNN